MIRAQFVEREATATPEEIGTRREGHQQPDGRSTRREGHQRWRDLLFLHWPVRPEPVRAAVPRSLPLDLHEGWAWLGVVAFEVQAARPPLVHLSDGVDVAVVAVVESRRR